MSAADLDEALQVMEGLSFVGRVRFACGLALLASMLGTANPAAGTEQAAPASGPEAAARKTLPV